MATRLWHRLDHLSLLAPVGADESAPSVMPAFVTYGSTEEALNQYPWTEASGGAGMMPMGPEQAREARRIQEDAHAEAVGGEDVRGYVRWFSSGSLAPTAAPLLIREGTTHTGARVWEGGIVLMHWASSHKHLFEGRSVLELGAGCGALGLAVAKAGGPREVVVTDFQGHFVDSSTPSLTDLLLENARANLGSIGGTRVSVWSLDWERPLDAKCCALGGQPAEASDTFEVILGSEIVYSVEGAGLLLKVIPTLLADEGACYLLNNVHRSGVSELIRRCGASQLACEELPLERPAASSVMYTMGDNELSNDFVLLKITRATARS